jgi:DNA-directed RNA polymerase subunit E"
VSKLKEKACKNCHLITKNETICPKCKTHTLSEDYTGEVIIINPEESKIAQNLKIHFPGKYALRVR